MTLEQRVERIEGILSAFALAQSLDGHTGWDEACRILEERLREFEPDYVKNRGRLN